MSELKKSLYYKQQNHCKTNRYLLKHDKINGLHQSHPSVFHSETFIVIDDALVYASGNTVDKEWHYQITD